MSRQNMYLCGTPKEHCGGSLLPTSDKWKGSPKGHGSRADAMHYYGNYLKSQGYEQIGSREFKSPNGGPVLVLTKVSRFGGRMRKGKEKRVMPKDGSGLIY